jgi:hypothetical protein
MVNCSFVLVEVGWSRAVSGIRGGLRAPGEPLGVRGEGRVEGDLAVLIEGAAGAEVDQQGA